MKKKLLVSIILIFIPTAVIYLVYTSPYTISAKLFSVTYLPFLFFSLLMIANQALRLKKIKKTAFYDELTGLPNQTKFKITARRLIKENPDKNGFIVKFDIENFKMINDIFSFEIGDLVLKKTVIALKKNISETNAHIPLVCRVGEDQFLLLGFSLPLEENEMCRKNFETLFKNEIADILGSYKIIFKYGRYFFSDIYENIDEIIEKVNMVHRQLKTQKEKIICDYTQQIKERAIKDITFINRMDYALENGEFKLYLQPKYNLRTGELSGAEALARWQFITGELILPAEFIPIFEKNGSIVKLDLYMLRQVCQKLRFWIDSDIKPIDISVNFSKRHLQNPLFADSLCAITGEFRIPHALIEAELTESTMLDNADSIMSVLEKLRTCGFALSMDDFGAGYSSLGLLKNIPIDTIKIDKSFLADDSHQANAKVIIESVVTMAKKLHLKTVAEGVETAEQVEFLKEIGCDLVQGFYYAKPMPVDEFELLLQSQLVPDLHMQRG